MILTFAEHYFSAAHRGGPEGRIHGHTWRVRACWEYTGQDAMGLKRRLLAALEDYDHRELPPNAIRAEDIAAHLGAKLMALEVQVWRDCEGLGAVWLK